MSLMLLIRESVFGGEITQIKKMTDPIIKERNYKKQFEAINQYSSKLLSLIERETSSWNPMNQMSDFELSCCPHHTSISAEYEVRSSLILLEKQE